MNTYVIGYDISDTKRLIRMHRFLRSKAIPVQKSIFILYGNEASCQDCLLGAEKIFNPREDSLCCYKLPEHGRRQRLGLAALPDGIFLPGIKLGEKC